VSISGEQAASNKEQKSPWALVFQIASDGTWPVFCFDLFCFYISSSVCIHTQQWGWGFPCIWNEWLSYVHSNPIALRANTHRANHCSWGPKQLCSQVDCFLASRRCYSLSY